MVAFDGAVFVGCMVEDIGGEKGILRLRELFPFLFHFRLFSLFSEGQAGKEKQESQEQGKELFHFIMHNSQFTIHNS